MLAAALLTVMNFHWLFSGTAIGFACSALLVLHRLFGARQNWQTTARWPAGRHLACALDMRNHGASPRTDTMTYPEIAEDILGHIVAKGLSRPV